MDGKISDLLRIIEEEICLYRDLIDHSRKKNVLLSRGTIDAVVESNKVEETLHIKLRFLDSELKRLCSDLCRDRGIEFNEFTLMKLADKLEQPAGMEIGAQTALLKKVVLELKSVVQRNQKLIQNSLRYSQGLLGLISNATSPYQPTGSFRSIPSLQPLFSKRA